MEERVGGGNKEEEKGGGRRRRRRERGRVEAWRKIETISRYPNVQMLSEVAVAH